MESQCERCYILTGQVIRVAVLRVMLTPKDKVFIDWFTTHLLQQLGTYAGSDGSTRQTPE